MRNAMLMKWYRFRIGMALTGTGAGKKAILNGVLVGVEEYLENHLDADYKALTENFGSPKQIAESYWSVNGGSAAQHTAILAAMLRVVAVLALFVAITWGLVVVYAAIDAHKEENGYSEFESSCEASYNTVDLNNENEV